MRLLIPSDVVFRELAGETVLLDLTSGNYFGLDPTATRIWQLLQESSSVDAVIARLLAEYDVPEAQLRSDVQALVDRLIDRGLLLHETAAPAS